MPFRWQRVLIGVGMALVASALVGCDSDSGGAASDSEPRRTTLVDNNRLVPPPSGVCNNYEAAPDYVGLTAEAAIRLADANGVEHRIAALDGERRLLEGDLRPTRVNLDVGQGIVVAACLF
jgi:hypothetical protein